MNTTPRDTPPNGAIQVFYPWKPAFLSTLRASGSPTRAAEAARVDRRWVYRVRASDAEFREAWDDAIAGHGDDLQAEAHRRAVHGVRELVLHRGKPVTVWLLADGTVVPPHTDGATGSLLTKVTKSDSLLLRLLAAARPAEFGTPRQREAARAASAPPAAAATFDVFARIRELTGVDLGPAEASVRDLTDDQLNARLAHLDSEREKAEAAEAVEAAARGRPG